MLEQYIWSRLMIIESSIFKTKILNVKNLLVLLICFSLFSVSCKKENESKVLPDLSTQLSADPNFIEYAKLNKLVTQDLMSHSISTGNEIGTDEYLAVHGKMRSSSNAKLTARELEIKSMIERSDRLGELTRYFWAKYSNYDKKLILRTLHEKSMGEVNLINLK